MTEKKKHKGWTIPGHFHPSLSSGAGLRPGNKAMFIHSLCTHGLASE